MYYSGTATYIRVKPKGSGTQDGLLVYGQIYTMQNSNSYVFTGNPLTVTVYNDHIGGDGRATGKWKFDISGMSTIDDSSSVVGSQLVQIDHKVGQSQRIMTLQRTYDSLAATQDGKLYASYQQQLYRIDPATNTETLVGPMLYTGNNSMEAVGSNLVAFSTVAQRLVQLNPINAQTVGAVLNPGVQDLGSIVLMLTKDEPATTKYD